VTGIVAPPEIEPGARALLRMLVASQERERQYLRDAFHDGPIQEFTAILLSAAAVRRQLAGAAAERLTALEAQLRDAITTLQLPPPVFRLGRDARAVLEAALTSRVLGPFTRALDAELELTGPDPSRDDLAELLGVVQLLLLAADPQRPAAHATVTVHSGADGLTLALGVTPDPRSAAEAETSGSAAERTSRFTCVAALTGARVAEHTPAGPWHATVRWPRR
jgi:hypothetical protein